MLSIIPMQVNLR